MPNDRRQAVGRRRPGLCATAVARPSAGRVQSPAVPAIDRNLRTTDISPQAYKTGASVFVLAVLGTHAFFLWSVRARIAKGDPDFTVFYTAGIIVREGRASQLYDGATQQAVQRQFVTDADIRRGALPYIHPPFEALLFLPLTYLPYSVAFTLWNAINLGLLFVVAALLRDSVSVLRTIALWKLVLIALAFFPVFANFHQGQDAILLLLLVVLGFRALERGEDFTAGLWLGLAVFKYHLMVPLFLILALWKGWRLVAGFAAMAAAVAALSIAIVGWRGGLEYPAYAWRVVSGPMFGGIPYRQLPNVAGLVVGWPFTEEVGWPVQMVVIAATLALLIVVVRVPGATNDRRMFRLCVSCAVMAALLAGFSTNTYDLSLLVLPLVLVADHCFSERNENAPVRSAVLIPAIALLISPLWFLLWMRWARINVMAVFLLWWIFAIRSEILRLKVEKGEAPIRAVPA